MFIELAVYLAAGAAAGILAGLLGIGGGLVLVPILSTAFLIFLDSSYSVHLAIATSLATIIITGLSSVIAHNSHGAVRWDIFLKLLPWIVLGAFGGAWLSQIMSGSVLAKVFGVMELLMAAYLIIGKQPSPERCLPGRGGLAAVGSGVGSVAALLGMGGGALTTPYFIWCNVKVHQAIATSASIGLPIALSGTLGFMLAGWGQEGLPEYTTGFVYWPAFLSIVIISIFTARLGANLAHKLPVDSLKKVFGWVLVILGIKMLFF